MEALKKSGRKKAFGLFASSVWTDGLVCVCVCVWSRCYRREVVTEESDTRVRAVGRWRSQSCLFQVVEIWHTRSGRASEAVPVLASFDAHLLRVGVALGAAQGGRVPARIQLSGQRVRWLSGLELGRADPWVTPALGETALSRGWVRQRLVAHVRRCGLVGRWGGKVQELAQRLQRLALKDTTEHKISEERKIALKTGLIPSMTDDQSSQTVSYDYCREGIKVCLCFY